MIELRSLELSGTRESEMANILALSGVHLIQYTVPYGVVLFVLNLDGRHIYEGSVLQFEATVPFSSLECRQLWIVQTLDWTDFLHTVHGISLMA